MKYHHSWRYSGWGPWSSGNRKARGTVARANPPGSSPPSSAVTDAGGGEGVGGGVRLRHRDPPAVKSAAAHNRVMERIRRRGIHSSCSARAGEERASRVAG